MEIAILLNKIAEFSLRAKIETLLNAKSCQRSPGLAVIVINNLLGEDQGRSDRVAVPSHLSPSWRPSCPPHTWRQSKSGDCGGGSTCLLISAGASARWMDADAGLNCFNSLPPGVARPANSQAMTLKLPAFGEPHPEGMNASRRWSAPGVSGFRQPSLAEGSCQLAGPCGYGSTLTATRGAFVASARSRVQSGKPLALATAM